MKFKIVWRVVGACIASLVALSAVGFLSAGRACAHDPRFACSPRSAADAIRIADPQKSWAFYGHLAPGQTDAYVFTSARRLVVPASLLIDKRDASNASRPEVTMLDERGNVVARIAGLHQSFYEPFSREDYLTTEDQRLSLPPGSYTLLVSMRGTEIQRYVLAFGEEERFAVTEIPYVIGAISRIRDLKY